MNNKKIRKNKEMKRTKKAEDIALNLIKQANRLIEEQGDAGNNNVKLRNYDSSINSIYIPKKIHTIFKRVIKAKDWKRIDKDRDVAEDLVAVFLSFLCYPSDYTEEDLGWKHLHSPILQDTFGVGVYTEIIKVLEEYKIIEVNRSYQARNEELNIEGYSRRYRLTEPYFKGGKLGCNIYHFKSEEVRDRMTEKYKAKIAEIVQDEIVMNDLTTYAYMTLPPIEEVLQLLIDKKHNTKTRDGKKVYKWYGTNSAKSYNYPTIDILNLFKNFLTLITQGLMLPIISYGNAGKRVTTSINQQPKIIRDLIKIDNEETVEVDMTCFHPNIAMTIYSDIDEDVEAITHDKVAKYLGISRKEAKIEHLSFFNKNIYQMRESSVFEYYNQIHPKVLNRIMTDKIMNGYKSTTRKLFTIEVETMRLAINLLRKENIKSLYIYDALRVKKSDAERVRELMNKALEMYSINTHAEIDI